MPILSEVGQRISLWLHEVIYSMPSPGNRTLNVGVTPNDDAEDIHARLADLIEERGETKALAGGIGPMSFAGSGYGFMLVITVCQVSSTLKETWARRLTVFRLYC